MNVDFVVQSFDQKVGLSRYAEALVPRLREHHNVTIRRPGLPDFVQRPLSRFGDPETFFASFPLAYDELDGDVLHLSAQTLGTPLLYAADRPTVITVHDIFPSFLPEQGLGESRPWYERFAYRLAMHALRKADHLIADSEATKRSLAEQLDLPTERITTVHLGVDHDRFRPMDVPAAVYDRFGLDPDDRHVLYVGSEAPRKAVPELVEAFAAVRETIPDAKLLKVGGPHVPDGRAQTEDALAEFGLDDHAVFTGYVPDEDLPALYNVADAFASTSYHEGFGFPFVEAMACGTPALGRDRSAMRELLNKDLRFESTSDLAESLTALLSNSSECKERSRDVRERAREFTWAKTAARTGEIYQAVQRGE